MDCPVSGRRSRQVALLTVRSLVRQLPLAMPSTAYYFCGDPGCDVVYFPGERGAPVFRRADLWVRVGQKENSDPVPVCYCFGFTREDILDDLRQNGESRIAERIKAEVQAGRCACELKNPSGQCCLGNVSRVISEKRKTIQRAT
jgi:hypothetical protein